MDYFLLPQIMPATFVFSTNNEEIILKKKKKKKKKKKNLSGFAWGP